MSADAPRKPMVALGGRSVPEDNLQRAISRHRRGAYPWPRTYGPPPGQPGCLVPPHFLLQDGASAVSFSGGQPRVTLHVLDGIPAVPPRKDIVEGLFQSGELVVLVGAPKAGKSALAVHLTQAVASGTPFLGRDTRRGAVAYMALERAKETVRRLRAVGTSSLPVLVSWDRPSLGDEADVEAMIQALQAASAALPSELPLGLVIIDTARKALRGLRESESDSVSVGLEALRRIMRSVPSAAVVLLHHLTKDGSSARGSGAILADADLEMTVVSRNGRRTVEVTGANAVEEGQVLPFDLLTVIDADGASVISVAPSLPRLSAAGPKAGPRLPPDAQLALDALRRLGPDPVNEDSWRAATYEAFGARTSAAKRVAWRKLRNALSTDGLVTTDADGLLSLSAKGVSVSAALADRKRTGSAYGAEGVSAGVSAPSPIGGGAYAAYAPGHSAVEPVR